MTYSRTLRFAWDRDKNAANNRKHGVTFEEASEVFTSGEDYLEVFDAAHSDVEDRFIAIGTIARGVVLVVWTERDEDVIRIISARFATARERAMHMAYRERHT